jgi:hypothetical protein
MQVASNFSENYREPYSVTYGSNGSYGSTLQSPYSHSASIPRQNLDDARHKAAMLEIEEGAGEIDPVIARKIREGLIDANDVAPPNGEEFEGERRTFRRKVKKMVEVPITRKVKVPITQQKMIEDVETKVIKVKKQIEEPSFKWVDEAYTEIEEQPCTRMKEIWVKKMVPETYLKKIEVRKTRRVKVPTVERKEIEVEQEITVPTTRIIDVPGYRVDEIKDTKIIEVEGWQEVELVPRVKDTSVKIERTKELNKRRRRVERRIGVNEYDDRDMRLDNVDTDSDPSDVDGDAEMLKTAGDVYLDGTEKRTRPKGSSKRAHRFLTTQNKDIDIISETFFQNRDAPQHAVSTPNRGMIPQPPRQQDFVVAPPATPKGFNRFASSGPQPASTQPSNVFMMFGFRLVEQMGVGLLITQVTAGGYADRYGLKVGDTIMEAENQRINTIRDWRGVLGRKLPDSELYVKMLRSDGMQEMTRVVLSNFNPEQYQDRV